MEALKSIFDSNGDGKLGACDTDPDAGLFKVPVTNADGTTTLKTMAQAAIASIGLMPNKHGRTYEDGADIIGTTTYAKTADLRGTINEAR